MIPAIGLFLGMMLLPESPRWLARHGRWDQTMQVLTLVHGKGDAESPLVKKEMAEIREVVEFEKQNADVTYLDLFKPNMIHRTMIGLWTQIWSQLTGKHTAYHKIRCVKVKNQEEDVELRWSDL
jgi:hypothetical protein